MEPHHALIATLKVGENAYVVSVEGDLDLHSAPRLAAELDALVAEAPDVALDLGGAGFLDSTALGVIVAAARQLRETGGRLALACATEQVRSVVELVGVDRVVPVFDSAERALEQLSV